MNFDSFGVNFSIFSHHEAYIYEQILILFLKFNNFIAAKPVINLLLHFVMEHSTNFVFDYFHKSWTLPYVDEKGNK